MSTANPHDQSLNYALVSRLAPNDGRYPILRQLTPQQEVALLARTSSRKATTITLPAISPIASPMGRC